MTIRRFLFLIPVAFVLSLGLANASSIGFPIPGANAQTMIGLTPGGTTETFTVTPGTSANGSVTSASGSASAFANLTTGTLGVQTQGTAGPSANATAWEFLIFNSDATISYAYDVTGTLNNAATNGVSTVSAGVSFYNVTGLSSPYFATLSSPAGYQYADGTLASNSSQEGAAYGGSASGDLPVGSTDVLNSSGANVPLSLDVTGSVNVIAGDLYIVDLSLTGDAFQIGSSNEQGSDFLDPATFSFTNLDGATFTSSSGEFLSAATVPEPSTLVVLSSMLLGLGLAQFLRQRRPADSLPVRRHRCFPSLELIHLHAIHPHSKISRVASAFHLRRGLTRDLQLLPFPPHHSAV
jgi:hypothetical protein